MENAKITIQGNELEIMCDTNFFVQKKIITDTISNIFATLRDELKTEAVKSGIHFPEGTDIVTGKLSKGENYRQLPYIILDFPKKFSKETVFSFRTMFWWGNHFSFHFHLSGEALETYRHQIAERLHLLKGKDFFVCVNASPWEYNFDEANFLSLDSLSFEKNYFDEKSFFKIGRKIELQQWDKVVSYGRETFAEYMTLLK